MYRKLALGACRFRTRLRRIVRILDIEYTETDEKIIDPSNNESKVDEDDVFLKPKNVKKARRIRMGNKFMHKGKCYESPFFKKEEETKNLFFCGGNVSGLNYKAFKDSFLK